MTSFGGVRMSNLGMFDLFKPYHFRADISFLDELVFLQQWWFLDPNGFWKQAGILFHFPWLQDEGCTFLVLHVMVLPRWSWMGSYLIVFQVGGMWDAYKHTYIDIFTMYAYLARYSNLNLWFRVFPGSTSSQFFMFFFAALEHWFRDNPHGSIAWGVIAGDGYQDCTKKDWNWNIVMRKHRNMGIFHTPWKINKHTNHPWKERNMIWTKPPWCSMLIFRGVCKCFYTFHLGRPIGSRHVLLPCHCHRSMKGTRVCRQIDRALMPWMNWRDVNSPATLEKRKELGPGDTVDGRNPANHLK